MKCDWDKNTEAVVTFMTLGHHIAWPEHSQPKVPLMGFMESVIHRKSLIFCNQKVT